MLLHLYTHNLKNWPLHRNLQLKPNETDCYTVTISSKVLYYKQHFTCYVCVYETDPEKDVVSLKLAIF